jgi:hypothetical protein
MRMRQLHDCLFCQTPSKRVGTSFAGVLYVLRATWKALKFGDNLAERMNWRVPTVLLHRYEQAFSMAAHRWDSRRQWW